MLISSIILSSGFAILAIPFASPLSAAIGALPGESSKDTLLSDLQPITLTGLQLNPLNSTPALEPHCFRQAGSLRPLRTRPTATELSPICSTKYLTQVVPFDGPNVRHGAQARATLFCAVGDGGLWARFQETQSRPSPGE